MDFFSKERVFNLVGLAAGFAFSSDDLVRANVRFSLVNQGFTEELHTHFLTKCVNLDKKLFKTIPINEHVESFVQFNWTSLEAPARQIIVFSKLFLKFRRIYYNLFANDNAGEHA